MVRNRNTQNKQEREADRIAEGYEKRGVSGKEAERLPSTRLDGGGKKSGSGRTNIPVSGCAQRRREGRCLLSSRSAKGRSESAKQAAATRSEMLIMFTHD